MGTANVEMVSPLAIRSLHEMRRRESGLGASQQQHGLSVLRSRLMRTEMPTPDCPDKAKHTVCPDGYIQWHDWAKEKEETHVQEQCPKCGKWAIWKRKRVGNNA